MTLAGCLRPSPRLTPLSASRTRALTTSTAQRARAPDSLLRLKTLSSESDHAAARQWVAGFAPDDIPKEGWEASYSRSSGPGGQHVNKTNSKATVRCDLTAASGSWLPHFLLPPLSKSPHYLPAPPALLVSSQTSRSAGTNLSSALAILHRTIRDAASSVIVGETTGEQRERVRGLVKAEKARVRAGKERRSDKKASRRDLG